MTNYTPVDHLTKVKKQITPTSSGGPEKGEHSGHKTETKSFEIHEVGEHLANKDVESYIDVKKEKIKITDELKNAGAVDTGTTSFPVYNPVKLPVSDEDIYKDLRAPATSSARWFGEVCLYILKQAHQTIKKIHGKIVRVIQ